MARVEQAAVEAILSEVNAVPAAGDPRTLELWVPDRLTHEGETISADVGRAMVLEAVMKKGFKPDSTQHEPGGKLCRYWR